MDYKIGLQEQVIPKDVYRTKTSEQRFSQMVLVGRKALGV